MKKLIMICLVLFFTVGLFALGSLKVESIKELPVTHTNLDVIDADGKFAPLLLVKTELEGLGFQNIGRPTKHPAVYEIGDHHYKFYLNDNQRVIKITHSNYEALEVRLLSDFKINVKAQRVYEMVLINRPEKNYIPVNIITNPEDAEKIVDGEKIGTGNSFEISTGKHNLILKKDGYKTIEQEIEVSEDNFLFDNFNLEILEPINVTIQSKPQKANVVIDEIVRDPTNCGVWLNPGKYKIVLSKPGYFDIEDTIEIKENDLNTFEYKFVKNVGVLDLIINPVDANLIINNTNYFKHKIELKPGIYEILITKNQFINHSEKVEIKLGEIEKRNINLTKNVGILKLNITPIDAQISLNNQNYTGQNEIELKPGSYKINVSKAGFNSMSAPIQITLSKTISKTFDLIEKVGTLQFEVAPIDAKIVMKKNDKIYDSWEGLKYLKSVPIGSYQLFVNREEYAQQQETIEIIENEIHTKKIVLKRFDATMLSKAHFHKKQKWYSLGSVSGLIAFGIISNLISDGYYDDYNSAVTTSKADSNRDNYEKWDKMRDSSYYISIVPIIYGTYNWISETYYKNKAKRGK